MTARAFFRIVVCTILTALSSALIAADYPARPVRIIVPFGVGGISDQFGRAIGDALAAKFNQPFVIDNRTGAGGAIGTDLVAKATPDGYTLLLGGSGQLTIVPQIQRVGYDPLMDLAPISNLGTNFLVLTIHPSLGVRNVREFVDHIKANPGKVTYASAGPGSISHFSAMQFLVRGGLDMLHVPYKGGPQATLDLVAGQVQSYFGNEHDVIPHAKAGRVRLIAVTSGTRSKRLPDVASLSEVYPGFNSVTWSGLFAPAGTPPAVINRISEASQKAMREPAMASRLERYGIDPVGSSSREFQATVLQDHKVYGDLVKRLGLKSE